MGIILSAIEGIIDGLKDEENTKNKELEKEMDANNLEDWQKEEVRKGNASPWDFEEEDLEDGDYYDEDED